MGREVRRVPLDWVHPSEPNGQARPLIGGNFLKAVVAEYDFEKMKWEQGFFKKTDYTNYCEHGGKPEVTWEPKTEEHEGTFAEWNGERPRAEDYMPVYDESEKVGYQMYETTTEGTPISPVFKDPEQLAHWLADTGASAFGGYTSTYEEWLAMIVGPGYSMSAIFTPGEGMQSGVSAISNSGMYATDKRETITDKE